MSETTIPVEFDIEELMTDKALEEEGVWRDLPRGGRVKVARTGNDAYIDLLARRYKQHRAVIDQEDSLSRKKQIEITIEVMAHTILKDVQIRRKGQLITKYTPELGMELLAIKDFRTKVSAFSEDFDAYQLKHEEAALEN